VRGSVSAAFRVRRGLALALLSASVGLPSAGRAQDASPPESVLFAKAAENGSKAEEAFRRTRRLLHAWLGEADPRTLLLPDYTPHFTAERGIADSGVYRPHNSGADNYPYLVLTAYFTDRPLFEGRMLEMLRNEVRFTNVADAIPGELRFADGRLGPLSIFGAAEWCKDGALPVTEMLGRTPWFERMVDMTLGVMKHAPVASAFGRLPDSGAEVNGDLLQTLIRLYPMTGDRRFLEFAERIGDAYVEEVLPRLNGLPGYEWDFTRHEGPDRLRLRDHGNEIVVGLVLLHALEEYLGTERGRAYRPVVGRMLDRVLESANRAGMFFDEIRCSDLTALKPGLVDTWGYLYGAVYTYSMVTGEPRYREAVVRVLENLPRYRGYDWEGGRQDGYADALEGALYLISREPVPQAIEFIESEIPTLIGFQQDDGLVEGAYPDGNWARTLLLYAFWKTQGTFVEGWRPGVELGAHREGDSLYLSIAAPEEWKGALRFDVPRHRSVMNLDRNYVRLNEWPEWFVVEEGALYEMRSAEGTVRVVLGAELRQGIAVGSGRWIVRRTPSSRRRPPAPSGGIGAGSKSARCARGRPVEAEGGSSRYGLEAARAGIKRNPCRAR
jgi:hypothetical protein